MLDFSDWNNKQEIKDFCINHNRENRVIITKENADEFKDAQSLLEECDE